jgi:prepilin-type N-terminal cleavage/methylation domain-containing protein
MLMQSGHKQQGFTVVELLISISLFAILIPTITLGLGTLIQINNRARDLTLISILAENKIESLRSIGFNSVTNGTTDFTSELPKEINSPRSAAYAVVQANGNKTVTVTITYSDYKKPRTVVYRSIISETGVGQ